LTASWLLSRSRSSISSLVGLSVGEWRLIRFLIPIVFTALAIASASGCARTVLVSEGSPIRVGPSSDITIYTMVDGQWVLSSGKVRVSEGWYLVSPSFVENQ
jgi:hypothetical protein